MKVLAFNNTGNFKNHLFQQNGIAKEKWDTFFKMPRSTYVATRYTEQSSCNSSM